MKQVEDRAEIHRVTSKELYQSNNLFNFRKVNCLKNQMNYISLQPSQEGFHVVGRHKPGEQFNIKVENRLPFRSTIDPELDANDPFASAAAPPTERKNIRGAHLNIPHRTG